jgi:hypothetical protein
MIYVNGLIEIVIPEIHTHVMGYDTILNGDITRPC